MHNSQSLPGDVQEKLNLLSEYRRQILELESRLQRIRADYHRIQSELSKYGTHVIPSDVLPERNIGPQGSIFVGIDKLPNETLLHVFEYFLSDNHRHIRRLATVCRHWHRVVMYTPRLWARVQLSPVAFGQYQASRRSLSMEPYINACLQRSQRSLLDVELDYEDFCEREVYFQREVQRTLEQIADPREARNIYDWVLDRNCDFPSCEYDGYFLCTIRDLRALLGPYGAHMMRWRTLDLRLPRVWLEPDLAREIWAGFVGRTPNLNSMILSEAEGLVNVDEWDDQFPKGFPMLSGLRRLTLDATVVNSVLMRLSVSPSVLEHLHIDNHDALEDISALSTFTQLRTLSLCLGTGLGCSRSGSQPFVVRLPRLQALTLWGKSNLLEHTRFETPSLQELTIYHRGGYHIPPGLTPTHICWILDKKSGASPWGAVVRDLPEILQASDRINTMTVKMLAYASTPNSMEELIEAVHFPPSLRTIIVELENGKRVTHVYPDPNCLMPTVR